MLEGLFEIQLHRKGHPVALKVARGECACTIGAQPSHTWTERCDRFPPLVATRADGTEVPISELRQCFAGHDLGSIITAKRISEARHCYLVDLELWAYAHNNRHPIANAHRAARKWKGFLDD